MRSIGPTFHSRTWPRNARAPFERVQRSSSGQLYLTGLDQDDAKVADAAAFTLAAMKMVADIGSEFGYALPVRAGMSAGDVATGVLGTSQLSFGVWGDPTSTAVTLAALARPGEVLADQSVVGQLDSNWDIEAAEQFPGLSDDIDAHVINGRIAAPTAATNDPH
jgi:class 3 adenylate cyclase